MQDCDTLLEHCIRVLKPGESFGLYYRSRAEARLILNNLRTDCQQCDAVVSEAIPTGFLVIISHPRTKVVTTEELEAR